MSFIPNPEKSLTIKTEITLSKMLHMRIEHVASSFGMTVSQVIAQFLQWGIDEKHLRPVKKMKKPISDEAIRKVVNHQEGKA